MPIVEIWLAIFKYTMIPSLIIGITFRWLYKQYHPSFWQVVLFTTMVACVVSAASWFFWSRIIPFRINWGSLGIIIGNPLIVTFILSFFLFLAVEKFRIMRSMFLDVLGFMLAAPTSILIYIILFVDIR